MTSIANASVLVNRLTGGNNGNPECFHWWKDPSAFTKLGGVWHSTWLMDGSPGPGATPGAVAAPTRATAGAFRMLNPTGGRQRWLRALYAASWATCRILIYDRLLHCSGMSGTITTAQSCGGALTRYTDASATGNFAMAEVYTDIGVTSTTITSNYVDGSGASRVSPATSIGGTTGRASGTAIVLPYDATAGANGVKSVTDVTLAATTGTAGDFGITICRPLYEINVGAVDTTGNGHGVRALALEDIELMTDACLGVLFMPVSTAMNYLRGNYVTVEA